MKTEIFIRHYLQKLRDRTVALEGHLSTLEDEWAPLQRVVQSLAAKHAAWLDDMENCLRRNKIRAIGVAEKIEGKNPVIFIENQLLTIFGKDTFSPMFSVERAHRMLSRSLLPGAPPRPFLFKMLNYKDRDAIVFKGRSLGSALVIINSKVSLFPDFLAGVQKQKSQFTECEGTSVGPGSSVCNALSSMTTCGS